MRATTRTAILLIFPLMIIGLIACGSENESAASGGSEPAVVNTPQSDIDSTVDDHADDADAHAEETALAAHNEEPHDDSISDSHEDEASEADGHSHAAAAEVDPDAPVIHIFGNEFGYESVSTEVEAEHPFTIMFHNEGMLEHDITFEGLEDMGGIHLQPGEDGTATFSLAEIGEYSYYCTVPGHFEAGMVSALAAVATVHEEDGHHDEEAVEEIHDSSDGHHDEDAVEEAHDSSDGHHDEDASEAGHEDSETTEA